MTLRFDSNLPIYTQDKPQAPTTTTGGSGNNIGQQIADAMLQSSVQTIAQASSGNPIMSFITGVVMNAMGIGATDATQATQGTQDTGTVDAAAIEQMKQGCAADLEAMQKAGITVSDWDKNNTCTLSVDGKTATLSISNSGQIQFGGDIDAIMEKLKASDSSQQESVDNQNRFIEQQQKSGDPVVGDVKTTSITVNGKSMQVNEYTTQSGKKLYLDDSGKQITPDN